MPAPTITSFSPTQGVIGAQVTITGTNFGTGAAANVVTFNGASAPILGATGGTQIVCTVPNGATTGPISVTVITPANGSVNSANSFTVLTGSGGGVPPDGYSGGEDDGPLTAAGLLPYLRAMLKDSADDIAQHGLVLPVWSDADLYRYMELSRGEYSRQRPRRAHTVIQTVANQQFYAAPAGTLTQNGIDDVLWAPAGYDLDQISALAAALAGGPGILWGGGVPVVGRVFFDSPASIRVWSIIREAWRQTFGGHWIPDVNGFNLAPVPTQDGLNVLVFYRVEQHWSDIPWQHRSFVLANALLLAIEALTIQIASGSIASGAKLSLGMRGLVQLIQQKYSDALTIREPGVTAGRS